MASGDNRMETKENTVITFRVAPDVLQTIETAAKAAGMNRTEYMLSRILSPDPAAKIAEVEAEMNKLTDLLGRMAEQPGATECIDPEHADLYGAGHCFSCDRPIRVAGN
jgi:uncharacterized protein (DUF1778 family)